MSGKSPTRCIKLGLGCPQLARNQKGVYDSDALRVRSKLLTYCFSH